MRAPSLAFKLMVYVTRVSFLKDVWVLRVCVCGG